ncbi:MAG TPA: hypothetical protein VNS22_21685 [Geminicoccus sp.]|uniref:hypothetical protein n=1 Tax=Geminicoccus sp. TaxID=2024832 RepID=UPI002C5731B5|nr:hypothetical protein [Geminicoccus sp.]HWL70968.1 hypothetical protein [Geminicoccus sp.]
MRVGRLIGQMLLLLLLAVPAWGQGMSVGGAGLDGPDPLTIDPFAASADTFGIDDPAGDGPAFTGRDVLAVLDRAELGRDPPEAATPGRVTFEPPAASHRPLGGVGEARLELHFSEGEDAVAIWRAFNEPGDAVGALPRLGSSLAAELQTDRIGVTHRQRDGDWFTCALARPAPDLVWAVCGLSVSLDPLQVLGMVRAALPPEGDTGPLIGQAMTVATWARDRWLAIENGRRSG